ncbi:MAG: Hsp20/alpha crystallin family protein [Gammaproteobacteria bacterium]
MTAEAKEKSTQAVDVQRPAGTSEVHPIENFYRFFDELLSDRWMSHPRLFRGNIPGLGLFGSDEPRVDIVENDHEVIVTANLPGVKKEDLELTVTESSLTIRASKKEEQEEKKGEYFRKEISQGEISRTLALPAEVNSEQAKAVYNDGVLKLTLPKVRSSKRQTIKVE